MADYQTNKVLIFSGINDIPVAPSATTGGNISHLYNLYNELIDLLQTDITAIENINIRDYSDDINSLNDRITINETDISNLSINITTNNSAIVSNTNDIGNISTQLTTINNTIVTNKNNSDTQFITVNNNITNNTNDISTNTTNISSINSNVSSLQNTVSTNSTNINVINSEVSVIKNDVINLQSNSGLIAESFTNNISFFIDTTNGSDSNNGLDSTTPFLTIDKLISVLITKHLPNNLTIAIKGTINKTIDLSGISSLINRKGKLNRPKITFTTYDVVNFIISHSGTLIKTNNDYPLYIEFKNCSFIANGNSLNIINSNSFYDFVQPCNFEATVTNVDSIFYLENTEVELSTFGNDLIFNNTNNANLEAAIIGNNIKGKFEKIIFNDISTAIKLTNHSYGENSLSTMSLNNGNKLFILENNSLLRTNRYSDIQSNLIDFDSSSTINNLIHFDKTFINPPLNIIIKILNNSTKDYTVLYGAFSGIFNNPVITVYADNTNINSQNFVLNKGQDLGISFNGSVSIDYISMSIVLYEQV